MEKKITCQVCGAEMAVWSGAVPKTCEYCDTPLEWEKLEMALLTEQIGGHMMGRRFGEARLLLEQALRLEPKNADLHILKLLCKLEMTDIDDLAGAKRLLGTYEEFGKAMEYGSESQKETYLRLQEQNRTALMKEKDRLQGEILQIRERMEQRARELKPMESLLNSPKWKKVLWILEMIFVFINVAFWTLGTLVLWPFVFVDAPFVVWLVFVIKRDRKRERAKREYPALTREQGEDSRLLAEKDEAFREWAKAAGLEESLA